MIRTFRDHLPEALAEALSLGLLMLAASAFAVFLEGEGSPGRAAFPDAAVRRALMGLAMGTVAVALISSPWGQRSGVHMNPAVTVTFLRLGKIRPADAALYVVFQVLGGIGGMGLATLLLGARLADPGVRWVATRPGPGGALVAFSAEAVLSFLLMSTVLHFSSHPRLSTWTPWAAGTLVALFIAFEAPLSGMSINPARSLASALFARRWDAYWVYLAAPLLGMLAAAELRVRLYGLRSVWCAKLHHHNHRRCIFRCAYPAGGGAGAVPASA